MDKGDNAKSMMIGVPGLILQGVGTYVIGGVTGYGVSVAGGILLILGLCFYARGKGYTMALGLLGLLSIVGLIILAVLPDKRKAPAKAG
jgi:hypothetical protein